MIPDPPDPEKIEAAGLSAWPALHSEFYDGWLLRYSNGYTKRANSINPTCPSTLPLHTKIDECRRRYADHHLPVVFRVTSLCAEPDLDDYLIRHHFQYSSPTKVMACSLSQTDRGAGLSSEFSFLSLDDWLSLFYHLSDFSTKFRDAHQAILSKICKQVVFLGLTSNGKSVACGMGVLDGHYCGLFSLLTKYKYRNQGFGSELVFALLNWALENDATYAYLQVQVNNLPAIHLYQKHQFQPIYEYWYRIHSDTGNIQ